MISNIRIDLPRDFLSKGCQEYVLCLTRDGERALLSAKKKGIETWFDAHVWTWIRNLVSHFRTIPTISYTFQEILPALQSAKTRTTDLSDILTGFNVTKYNTKHPKMSKTFFRVFSAIPFFPKTFEDFKAAKQPGKLETVFTHFQQEIDTLGKEFDRRWPERSWETNSHHRTGTSTPYDLLRSTLSCLQQNIRAYVNNVERLQQKPSGVMNSFLHRRDQCLSQEQENLISGTLIQASIGKTSFTHDLPTIEASFGKETIGHLRKWVSDVDQSCIKAQQASLVNRAVQYCR